MASAATYQADWSAFFRSIGTFAIGVLAAIAAAVVVGLFNPTALRSEIVDRLSGAMGDYFLVALFSGLAGTYAFFSPKIHSALAGIAISVALIPPVNHGRVNDVIDESASLPMPSRRLENSLSSPRRPAQEMDKGP